MVWKHKKAENNHKSFLSKSRCISDTNKSNDQCLNFPSSCPRGAYEIQSRKHQESLPIDSHRTRLAPTPRAAGAQESDGNAQYTTPQSCLPGIQGSPLRRAGHGSQTACLPSVLPEDPGDLALVVAPMSKPQELCQAQPHPWGQHRTLMGLPAAGTRSLPLPGEGTDRFFQSGSYPGFKTTRPLDTRSCLGSIFPPLCGPC